MRELLTQEVLYYVVHVGAFLGILLLFTGLIQLVSNGESRGQARSRRMRMLAKGNSVEQILAVLRPRRRKGILSHVPWVADLPETLRQAGLTVPASTFLALCAGLTLAVFAVALTMTNLLVALVGALGAGFLLPLLVIRSRRDARQALLTRQLPDALDLMARGLKVGRPLNTSIGSVAQEMPDPIGTEFGLIFDEINFGEDLPDAVQQFADRVGMEDAQYLAASIGIQHGTGGDLARVLSILSQVIRDRLTMRQKIRAISSEGRLTAWFLSALPVMIFAFTNITSPDYFGGIKDDPLFVPMLAAIGGLTLLNFLLLRRVVTFRV